MKEKARVAIIAASYRHNKNELMKKFGTPNGFTIDIVNPEFGRVKDSILTKYTHVLIDVKANSHTVSEKAIQLFGKERAVLMTENKPNNDVMKTIFTQWNLIPKEVNIMDFVPYKLDVKIDKIKDTVSKLRPRIDVLKLYIRNFIEKFISSIEDEKELVLYLNALLKEQILVHKTEGKRYIDIIKCIESIIFMYSSNEIYEKNKNRMPGRTGAVYMFRRCIEDFIVQADSLKPIFLPYQRLDYANLVYINGSLLSLKKGHYSPDRIFLNDDGILFVFSHISVFLQLLVKRFENEEASLNSQTLLAINESIEDKPSNLTLPEKKEIVVSDLLSVGSYVFLRSAFDDILLKAFENQFDQETVKRLLEQSIGTIQRRFKDLDSDKIFYLIDWLDVSFKKPFEVEQDQLISKNSSSIKELYLQSYNKFLDSFFHLAQDLL